MRLRRGLDITVGGAPRQQLDSCEIPTLAGLLGTDYRGLRLRPLKLAGETVALGEAVLADRTDPRIVVTAPVAGLVEEVGLGPKRAIGALTIRAKGDSARRLTPPSGPGRDEAQSFLLQSGLWTALLRRPFGRIPSPDSVPAAIFLTATDTEPNAADPAQVIAADADNFGRGAAFLTALTDGPVFVCQPPGPPLAAETDRLRNVAMAGAHPAGLAGTHIDRLMRKAPGAEVWQIGYADVLALGGALRTGQLPSLRTVSLGGGKARDPRLVRLPPGADIEALAARESLPGPRRVLSGSALSGRESRFLRRCHTQITLLPRVEPPLPRRWLPATHRPLRRAALVPHTALDRALGPALPVVPLLRALSAGDADQAARLGALSLIEEDMALATYLSGGTEDFGARLRDVLDALEQCR